MMVVLGLEEVGLSIVYGLNYASKKGNPGSQLARHIAISLSMHWKGQPKVCDHLWNGKPLGTAECMFSVTTSESVLNSQRFT